MKRPAQKLANYLKQRELSIVFAESMTCGLAAHMLGSVSRTSDFLKASIVCYDEKVKISLLNVSRALIKKYSAESQEVTDALAKKSSALIKADIYAAVTGLAAPGGSETPSKPVGTVFFSIYYKRKIMHTNRKFNGSPLAIKKKACDELFSFIIKSIQ